MRLALLTLFLGLFCAAGMSFEGGVGVQPASAHCAVVAPANITVSTAPNQPTATVNYSPPTLEGTGCGGTTTCTPGGGSPFQIGTTTVTCTNNAAGSTGDSFTVRVNDTQPPTIGTLPQLPVQPTDPGKPYATVDYTEPTVTDNAPNPIGSCSPDSGAAFNIGITLVICSASDFSSNRVSKAFAILVADMEPPQLSVPLDARADAPPGQGFAAVAFDPAPQVSDNFPGPSVACTHNSGALFPVGTTEVTCTASDPFGNKASKTFNVFVRDVEAPLIQLVLRAKKKLRFVLSEAAAVRIDVQRCSKVAGKKCSAWKSRGIVAVAGVRGLNDFAFTNRLNGKRLPAGRYRAIFNAEDAGKNAAAPATLSFTLR